MKIHFELIALLSFLLVGAGCTMAASTASTLDLSGQELKNVPSSVFTYQQLRELDLSNNALTGALPGEIRQLQRLRRLDASDNQMTGVPAEIGQLADLEVLDLSNNNLTGLPLELGNLQQLQLLDLTGNDISLADLAVIRASLTETEIRW